MESNIIKAEMSAEGKLASMDIAKEENVAVWLHMDKELYLSNIVKTWRIWIVETGIWPCYYE